MTRWLTLMLVFTGAAAELAPQERLPVPIPVLDQPEAAVEEQLRTGRARLDALLTTGQVVGKELAAAYGQLGQLYLAYDLAEAARPTFENAAALDPADFRWPYYLGVILEGEGDFEAAAASFEKALALSPNDLAARVRLGRAQIELERLDAAEASFRKALELEPRLAAAFAGLGKIAALRGDPARAAESFRKALELQPQASSLHHPLGMALRDLGDLEGARAHLDQNRQGNVLIPDPLMRELTRLVRSAQFHLKAGNRAAARGDLELARGEYERATELAPGDATPLYNLGKILAETGDPAGAIARFEAAIAREPEHRDAHFNLATTLARLGRFGEAAEHFNTACRIDPHDLEAHLGRGMALLLGERYPQARAALEESLRAQPKSLPITNLLTRLLAAAPDAALRDGARALELARVVFGAEQSLEHAETLAMALAENGQFEEAAEWQGRVVAEAERRGVAAAVLARLRARLEGYRAGKPCRVPWLVG